jgi:hypothetical protein
MMHLLLGVYIIRKTKDMKLGEEGSAQALRAFNREGVLEKDWGEDGWQQAT